MTKAKHIDAERTKKDFMIYWDMTERIAEAKKRMTLDEMHEDFADSEKRYYSMRFGAALAKQNERHIKSRHEERIKTMDDWWTGRNTRPEESIYQIGDRKAKIDPAKFKAAAGKLYSWLVKWSEAHGEPFKVLNAAGHVDEVSPHLHIRRVWQYRDADGDWCIGQNKALEAAGVPLPMPGEPVSAKNNRKITFDRMVRAKWIEICESYGYQIERTADDTHTEHLPKEALIALHEKEAALEKARQEAEKARQEAEAARDKFHAMMGSSGGIVTNSEAVRARQRDARQLPKLPGM